MIWCVMSFRLKYYFVITVIVLSSSLVFAKDEDDKETLQQLKSDPKNSELILRDIKAGLRQGKCLNYLIPKMLGVIEVPGYVPNYNRPKPRPELENPELRDLWIGIVENGTGSTLLKRLLEIRLERGKAQKKPEGTQLPNPSLLTEGKLYNKIKSNDEIEIKEGLYQVGENLDNWVRLTNNNGKRFMMRTAMSRAQVFEILGYDPVRKAWDRLVSEQDDEWAKTEHWRQLNIPMDEWGDYAATFINRQDLKKILAAMPGWRLPTAFEYEIVARAGRTKRIKEKELKKQAIFWENAILGDDAWVNVGIPSRPSSPRQGLHTMSEVDDNPWGFEGVLGGVWEFTSEMSVGEVNQRQRGTKDQPLVDPEGVLVTDEALAQAGASRGIFGASWTCEAGDCDTIFHNGDWDGSGGYDMGLRLLRVEKNNP